jgi:hypothetical protein
MRFDGKTGKPLVHLTSEELRVHIQATLADNRRWLRAQQQSVRRLLPRRTRARLWLTKGIDRAAGWLIDHGHDRLAILFWRVFRLW